MLFSNQLRAIVGDFFFREHTVNFVWSVPKCKMPHDDTILRIVGVTPSQKIKNKQTSSLKVTCLCRSLRFYKCSFNKTQKQSYVFNLSNGKCWSLTSGPLLAPPIHLNMDASQVFASFLGFRGLLPSNVSISAIRAGVSCDRTWKTWGRALYLVLCDCLVHSDSDALCLLGSFWLGYLDGTEVLH